MEQANKIGEKLAEQLEGKQYVMYASDLLRAKHTGEIVAKYLGITPIIRQELREWNRLKPLFDEIMASEEENIIIVSHGDLLSVFNAMFLGLPVESLNDFELFGLAGGVSFMFENNEGKRFVKRMGDLSFIA